MANINDAHHNINALCRINNTLSLFKSRIKFFDKAFIWMMKTYFQFSFHFKIDYNFLRVRQRKQLKRKI